MQPIAGECHRVFVIVFQIKTLTILKNGIDMASQDKTLLSSAEARKMKKRRDEEDKEDIVRQHVKLA